MLSNKENIDNILKKYGIEIKTWGNNRPIPTIESFKDLNFPQNI